jgi:hypothetical protein
MSLVRLLPAWLHAIADYAVAISLIAVALIVGGTDKAVATGVVIGAVVLVVSMLTRYPLGVIKVLPFKLHSAGDYLAVVLLAAAPFALTFHNSDRGLTIFYLAAGAAVLLVSLITNYQYSPKGQAATARVKADSPQRREAPAPAADRSDANQWYTAASKARQPTYAAQDASSESWRDEPIYADSAASSESWRDEPTYAAPVASRPGPASRSLREILAERAASQESAA